MRGTTLIAVSALTVAAACRPPGALPGAVPGTAERAADGAALERRVPTALGAYRRVGRELLPGSAGTAFRFRDTSALNLTVVLYAPDADALALYPTPVALLVYEDVKFARAMELQARRGAIANYQLLVTRPDSVLAGSRVVPGHLSVASGAYRARPMMELQYLYLVDATFVKVRATVPQASWPRGDLVPAVEQLVAALASP